jgi:putative Mg2+ transporter-C (MgtC) family protein
VNEFLDVLGKELFNGLPDWQRVVRVVVRLLFAVVLGGVVGYERQSEGKSAGARTHMIVALGAALFTLIPLEAGLSTGDLTRVIQGVATGVGFLGAGIIYKTADQREVKGLTSAASIWLTAAVGTTVGAGWIWPAAIGVAFAWVILGTLHTFERWWHRHQGKGKNGRSGSGPPADGGTG